jgi:threonylcarbamoyladenosine tRNA methylthiotransferase MtaB
MSRVSFYTLGCKLNYAETGTLEQQFEERDFSIVPFGDTADVTVVNTCSVTAEADRKCRNVIRRALRANPEAFVIVTGCYAQLQPAEIAAIEGVDVVLGANEKFRLFQLIEEFSKQEQPQLLVSCIDQVSEYGPASSSAGRTRAFLKIQDGCDYSCSFCTIPMARGKSRSHRLEATLAEARSLAERGFREIVLSGVNIGLYGEDHGSSLFNLLKELDRVDGIERYRISSIEPNLLSDEIIDFVGESARFQAHFHVPLQSGDDSVLGRMRRRYRRPVYTDRVHRIKRLMPHAGIGADVIAGFPSEDARCFENSYQFINELPISYLHVFTYSERAGTAAAETDGVPQPERSRRNRMLRILSRKKEEAFYREHLGTTRPVLWEKGATKGTVRGYTDNYIQVEATSEFHRRGQVESVLLASLSDHGTVLAHDDGLLAVVHSTRPFFQAQATASARVPVSSLK